MPARSNRGRRPAVKIGGKRKIQEIEAEPEVPEKVFKTPFERDVDNIFTMIKNAGDRGFPYEGPASNLQMMELCAAPALAEVQEERYKDQQTMVGLLDSGLLNIEGRMLTDLKECEIRLAEADSVLANLEALEAESITVRDAKEEALRVAREENNKKKNDLLERKKIVDDTKRELKVRQKKEAQEQTILDALTLAYDVEFKFLTVKPEPVAAPVAPEAPAAPVEGEAAAAAAPIEEVEKKLEEVVIVEEEKPAKRSSAGRGRRPSVPKEPTIDERIERILEQMRLHGAEDSLLNALPFSLRVALENPREYDHLTLQACTKFFAEKRMWAEGNLIRVKAEVQEQDAHVKLADSNYASLDAEVTLTKLYVQTCLDDLRAAQKDTRTKKQDIADHKDKNVETRTRVESMGAWLTEIRLAIRSFTMLRDRCNPPPAPPAPIEEPVAEAPAEEIIAPAPETMEPILPEAVPMELA